MTLGDTRREAGRRSNELVEKPEDMKSAQLGVAGLWPAVRTFRRELSETALEGVDLFPSAWPESVTILENPLSSKRDHEDCFGELVDAVILVAQIQFITRRHSVVKVSNGSSWRPNC